jgi:hypothetical protein
VGEETKDGKSCAGSRLISIDEIRSRPRDPVSAFSIDNTPALHNTTRENRPAQSVIYIYDGLRRWWRIRRFQVVAALLFCIGIIIGMLILALTVVWSR